RTQTMPGALCFVPENSRRQVSKGVNATPDSAGQALTPLLTCRLLFSGTKHKAPGMVWVRATGSDANHGRNGMTGLTRRSVLRSSAALAAAGTIARPYIANAAAKTAEMWWAQGFVQEEDISIKKIVADYEKASGNSIDLSI